MSIFQFQCYCVLTHPEETIRALVDPRLVGLFRRMIRGQHDCSICRRTLNLDPTSDDSPGVVGYMHGDLPDEIAVVGVAACCGCVKKLGAVEVARTVGQMFVDELCGGGTVEMVQAGTA